MDQPKNKKILVVGGAGFIGSHTTVELFEAGYAPIIVDNFSNAKHTAIDGISEICGKPIRFYEGNACDREFLKEIFEEEKNISGAIHFAAFKAVGESVEKPLKYYTNNLGSLESLLEVMLDNGVFKLVFSSSATVYGQADILPVTENSPLKPAESPYGTTKLFNEKIIQDVVSSGVGLKAVLLRYFNPIGAHPSSLIGEYPLGVPNNLMPYLMQTAAGIREKLTVYGDDYDTEDGTCIRDYVHVVDLAKAHVKALEYMDNSNHEKVCEIFNIGTGRGNSVFEVINGFEKVSGEKLKYEVGERRAGDIETLYADVDKAKNMLGWESNLSLEEAIRDSWNWQKSLGKNKGE